MTEYTVNPQAYQEFMSARERTAYWVNNYHPTDVYSPSTAPIPLDDIDFVPPSPAMSTHSLPPKMVLRYNDGRRDIPIPHPQGRSSSRRSPTSSHGSHHSRPSPLGAAPSSHRDTPPPTPEEIRVLPSRSSNSNSPSSTRPGHHRSKSVPRRDPVEDVPFIAPPVPRSHPPQPHAAQQHYPPWVPSRPGHHGRAPPPIVYAPGRHHGAKYEPPLVFQHQPQIGPDGVVYSHSAPPVMQGAPSRYPPQHGAYRPDAPADNERNGRPMDRDWQHRQARGRPTMNRKGSSESLGSQESGSTYYVLPSAGQKVHVIVSVVISSHSPSYADYLHLYLYQSPSPERSVETASSTTKAGSSPNSQASGGSFKKPFLGRFFARFASPAPTKAAPPQPHEGRKLHRRHSVGASGRPKLVEQRA